MHGHPKIEGFEMRRHRADAPWTYEMLDRRQRIVAAQARSGGEGAFLLSEVAPVITMGRRARRELEITASDAELADRGVALYPCDRGGLATWHGPGQWVLFAVDRLERLTGDPRGVRKSVEAFLELACETARELGCDAEIRDGAMTGVWTARGKLASVGVHIENGILLHGLALNVVRTPLSFFGLRPCGLDVAVDFALGDASDPDFVRAGEMLAARAALKFSGAFSRKSGALSRLGEAQTTAG